MSDLVLECRDLHKRFGKTVAVDGVSLQVRAGETYGLLGPNGAGKTTTISMICGLLEPDAGEVVVAGQRLTTRSVEAKAAIGYVPAGARDLPGPHARARTCASSRGCTAWRRAGPARASTRSSTSSASPTAPTTRPRPTRAACSGG